MKKTITPMDAQDAIHVVACTICNQPFVAKAFEIRIDRTNDEIISSVEETENGFIYNGKGYNSLAELLAHEYFRRTAEKYDEMDNIPSALRHSVREMVYDTYHHIINKYMDNFGIDYVTLTTILISITLWREIDIYDIEKELIDAIVNTLGY